MAACPGASHRFETFALPAPSLGRPKRVLVYLPPGYACEAHRRYPVFYFNDGHDLFDWNPFAAELDPALAAEIAVREGWYGSWRLDVQLDRAVADGQGVAAGYPHWSITGGVCALTALSVAAGEFTAVGDDDGLFGFSCRRATSSRIGPGPTSKPTPRGCHPAVCTGTPAALLAA